jgi:two-component system response regulator GlrR
LSGKFGVLVVDDDADLLKLLEIRLGRAGFRVETARSGDSALRRLERFAPDVVVTDLKMEAMDGIELLTEIARHDPVLPVIVLTAHGSIPDAVVANSQGAFAFLTKPFEDEELISTIRDAALLKGTLAPPGESD